MVERSLKKNLNKEVNNEYVKYFKTKVETDLEKER